MQLGADSRKKESGCQLWQWLPERGILPTTVWFAKAFPIVQPNAGIDNLQFRILNPNFRV